MIAKSKCKRFFPLKIQCFFACQQNCLKPKAVHSLAKRLMLNFETAPTNKRQWLPDPRNISMYYAPSFWPKANFNFPLSTLLCLILRQILQACTQVQQKKIKVSHIDRKFYFWQFVTNKRSVCFNGL